VLDLQSQTDPRGAEAEAALIRRFAAAVRTFARRRLRTADAVDEFAQEVFLRLVQAVRAGQIEDPARIAGFVLGICRNLARERARIADRRGTLWELYGASLAALDEPPDVDGYRVALLEDCLTQLAHRSREVLRHAYVDGASAAEIAGRLAMTEGNVRVVRHRSLEALRACMTAKVFYEEAS
jgi:RNA polymerase sigma-70 factor (ECF subfamily)